jgi:hypothetical protein
MSKLTDLLNQMMTEYQQKYGIRMIREDEEKKEPSGPPTDDGSSGEEAKSKPTPTVKTDVPPNPVLPKPAPATPGNGLKNALDTYATNPKHNVSQANVQHAQQSLATTTDSGETSLQPSSQDGTNREPWWQGIYDNPSSYDFSKPSDAYNPFIDGKDPKAVEHANKMATYMYNPAFRTQLKLSDPTLANKFDSSLKNIEHYPEEIKILRGIYDKMNSTRTESVELTTENIRFNSMMKRWGLGKK